MFCSKKSSNYFMSLGSLILGMISGAALTTAFFTIKEKKKCALSHAVKNTCECDRTDNTYENFCECNGDPDDHERARNGFDCHSATEECDTDILHSHGCLGYPHDQYGGFANSNGDRPNDLSNPEIDNQKGIPEGNTSPYWEKNAQGKSNPQPENKVNEVKKK